MAAFVRKGYRAGLDCDESQELPAAALEDLLLDYEASDKLHQAKVDSNEYR